jgi:nitrite reductase/ring-hydroxylating ferredoxin subunit
LVRKAENEQPTPDFIYACEVADIPDNRAQMLIINGENIAIFKYDGKLSAVHNLCKHQNGPLSEGKIIDGCITCPWHGYQYRPEDTATIWRVNKGALNAGMMCN